MLVALKLAFPKGLAELVGLLVKLAELLPNRLFALFVSLAPNRFGLEFDPNKFDADVALAVLLLVLLLVIEPNVEPNWFDVFEPNVNADVAGLVSSVLVELNENAALLLVALLEEAIELAAVTGVVD